MLDRLSRWLAVGDVPGVSSGLETALPYTLAFRRMLYFDDNEALQETGLDIDYVQKIQEMRRRRHEVRLRQNGYWLGLLDMAHFHGINPTLALDYFDYVDALDVEVVQQAARRYFNRDNYVRVVLLPENYIE